MTRPFDGDRRALQDEINRRVHFFDPLPEKFDPLTEPAAALAGFGIPPRPDPDRQPALARFWIEMFSEPLKFVDQDCLLVDEPLLARPQLRFARKARHEASGNWSGAYVTPRDGQQLTEVHASWTVPSIEPPAGLPPEAEYRSSIWIGLDGQRRYFDSSLPQIGTAQFLNPTRDPPFWTWCQWWLRDSPHTFLPGKLSVPIEPRERVMASLRVLTETQVHCIIKNQSTGHIVIFTMDAPTDTLSGGRPRISGSTAEWIVERPTNVATGGLYDLPDYGRVWFTECLAVSARLRPDGTPGPGREQTLENAQLVEMYKIEHAPSRRVTVSKARRTGIDRVETQYIV